MPLEAGDILRLLAAVVAGAVVGFERELSDKPAGFRTNIMICLGAALFTLLSLRMAGQHADSDATRIAAQIVTGVGFLGAGAIIQYRANVIGLTTAATIWLVASVGMAFGAGRYLLGAVVTVLAAAVLFGLSYAEGYIAEWRSAVHFKIRIAGTLDVHEDLKRRVCGHGVRLRSWTITKAEDGLTIHATLVGPADRLERAQTELIEHESVLTLRRF